MQFATKVSMSQVPRKFAPFTTLLQLVFNLLATFFFCVRKLQEKLKGSYFLLEHLLRVAQRVTPYLIDDITIQSRV